MTDRTQHCAGCRERQAEIDRLREELPSAFRPPQSGFVGKSGSQVTIDCENGDEANEVFEWLINAIERSEHREPKP